MISLAAMGDFEKGSYVEHQAKPDWGIGVVGDEADGNVTITFHDGAERQFKRDTLESRFTPVPLERVPPDFGKQRARRTTRKTTAGSQSAARCTHCETPLNRSRYSQDRKLKSCPRCSVNNGKQHVFWPQPEAFGTTEARASEENADGIQSHCTACRQREEPSLDDAVMCDQLVSQGT